MFTLGSLLTTDLFTPVAWIGCAGLLVKMLRDGDHRRWIPFGIIVGLTLWTKYLIAFNLVALAVALPFTPLRRGLLTRWPYLAALIALAVVAPNVWWQAEHGFPFLELGANGVALFAPAIGPGTIAAAHQRGLAVMAWTVNDRHDAADLAAHGLDALCTDHPEYWLAPARTA